jgi:hypothetical protein
MAPKLMHAVQYDSYDGGPSGLKVRITHLFQNISTTVNLTINKNDISKVDVYIQ